MSEGTKREEGKRGRTGDCAMYDGPVLQLDGHCLVVQFHQKARNRPGKATRTSALRHVVPARHILG